MVFSGSCILSSLLLLGVILSRAMLEPVIKHFYSSNDVLKKPTLFWNISNCVLEETNVFSVHILVDNIRVDEFLPNDIIKEVHKVFKVPVLVFQESVQKHHNSTEEIIKLQAMYRKKRSPVGTSYIIVGETLRVVLLYINNFNPRWRSDAVVLFLILNNSGENEDDIAYEVLFQIIWIEYSIKKAIILSVSDEFERVFAYNPFEMQDNFIFGQIFKVDKFEASEISKHLCSNNFNMNGYLFKASVFQVQNSSTDTKTMHDYILETLSSQMNFTPELHRPEEIGAIEFPNGTIYGCLTDLGYENVDIILEPKLLKNYRTLDLDFVTPVLRFAKMCVLVPKATLIPSWESIFKCFSWDLWLVLLINFWLCVTFWRFLIKISSNFQNNPKLKFIETLSDTLDLFIPKSFPKLVQFTLTSERVFVSSCMLFSIIVTCIFQAVLFKILKNPAAHKEINTLEDLYNSGLPYFAIDIEKYQAFIDIDIEIARKLSEKIKINRKGERLVKNIAYNRNASVLIAEPFGCYLKEEFPNFNKYLHIADECPVFYMASYIVPKGSIYLPLISKLVRKMFEAGLTKLWYDNTYEEDFLPYRFKYRKTYIKSEEQKPFMLNDLLVAFIFLLAGLILGMIIFVVEISVTNRQFKGQTAEHSSQPVLTIKTV
ncbi:Ionotropic receptor 883 [Blattella germanica]|nr:Ionotropic receptor 883 [Blattella germanica]